MLTKVNLADKLDQIAEHWSPHIVGEVNDCAVKLVKFRGPFVWHQHENEDEMFLVVRGSFTMHLRDGAIALQAGEFLIVPCGVEHMPEATDEVHVLLFEPKTTLNTGNATDDPRTRHNLKRI